MTDHSKQGMQREEYIARINRVIDYVENNLDGDLSLETLAGVASFSRFHFHRIFKAMLNETLSRFIQRVRLEKAAMQLTSNPRKSITEIALDTGFAGSASFAKAFRDAFDMSASEFRLAGKEAHSKIGKAKSNIDNTFGNQGKDIVESSFYIDDQTHNPNWRIQMKSKLEMHVEVKEMPELTVAYVRHIGPYQGDDALFGELFGKLMTWAGPRGLIKPPETQVLSVYHDDPKITDEDKLRVSACITIPGDTSVDGEIGRMTLAGGKFAVARFELNSSEFESAWDSLMGGWMPESGYQPDDRLCYEINHNDPKEHPEGKHVVDICVPVRPL